MTQTFEPAWWLPGPHAQTIWPYFWRRKQDIFLRRERVILEDGDFVDVDWTSAVRGPIVLILHGLGGCIHSHYAKGMMAACHDQGWRAAFMHFRGCSEQPNRLPRSYHSGETSDLQHVLRLFARREPGVKIAAVGYSLGANVLLKYLGEKSDNLLEAAAAVSPPFDLACTADRIHQGLSRFYERRLMKRTKQLMQKKASQIQDIVNLEEALKAKTFWEFDNIVTAPLHGFSDVHHYYQESSCRQYLKNINTKTLILHAKDDPFIGRRAIPAIDELSPSIQLELYEKGGHVGFVYGDSPSQARCFQNICIPRFFSEFLS